MVKTSEPTTTSSLHQHLMEEIRHGCLSNLPSKSKVLNTFSLEMAAPGGPLSVLHHANIPRSPPIGSTADLPTENKSGECGANDFNTNTSTTTNVVDGEDPSKNAFFLRNLSGSDERNSAKNIGKKLRINTDTQNSVAATPSSWFYQQNQSAFTTRQQTTALQSLKLQEGCPSSSTSSIASSSSDFSDAQPQYFSLLSLPLLPSRNLAENASDLQIVEREISNEDQSNNDDALAKNCGEKFPETFSFSADPPPLVFRKKKKPYKELTLEEKVELIRLAERCANLSQASIADRYSIAKSNVCRILQRKDEYLQAFESSGCVAGSRKRKLRSLISTESIGQQQHLHEHPQSLQSDCGVKGSSFSDLKTINESETIQELNRRDSTGKFVAKNDVTLSRLKSLDPRNTLPQANSVGDSDELRSHMSGKHDVRLLMCRCCNWAFSDKQSLHHHVKFRKEKVPASTIRSQHQQSPSRSSLQHSLSLQRKFSIENSKNTPEKHSFDTSSASNQQQQLPHPLPLRPSTHHQSSSAVDPADLLQQSFISGECRPSNTTSDENTVIPLLHIGNDNLYALRQSQDAGAPFNLLQIARSFSSSVNATTAAASVHSKNHRSSAGSIGFPEAMQFETSNNNLVDLQKMAAESTHPLTTLLELNALSALAPPLPLFNSTTRTSVAPLVSSTSSHQLLVPNNSLQTGTGLFSVNNEDVINDHEMNSSSTFSNTLLSSLDLWKQLIGQQQLQNKIDLYGRDSNNHSLNFLNQSEILAKEPQCNFGAQNKRKLFDVDESETGSQCHLPVIQKHEMKVVDKSTRNDDTSSSANSNASESPKHVHRNESGVGEAGSLSNNQSSSITTSPTRSHSTGSSEERNRSNTGIGGPCIHENIMAADSAFSRSEQSLSDGGGNRSCKQCTFLSSRLSLSSSRMAYLNICHANCQSELIRVSSKLALAEQCAKKLESEAIQWKERSDLLRYKLLQCREKVLLVIQSPSAPIPADQHLFELTSVLAEILKITFS